MEIIRNAADPTCSNHLVNSVKVIDAILLGPSKFLKSQLKGLFGLANLTHNDDFASTISVCHLPLKSLIIIPTCSIEPSWILAVEALGPCN
jgi:hypothetical protein